MTGRSHAHAILILGSIAGAVALLALARQYRPDGVLGWLQDNLQVLFVLPYLVGIVMGGTHHSPNPTGVFLGAFVEVYLLAWIGWRITRRFKSAN